MSKAKQLAEALAYEQKSPADITREALAYIEEHVTLTKAMLNSGLPLKGKLGDTITIRKPVPYKAQGGKR